MTATLTAIAALALIGCGLGFSYELLNSTGLELYLSALGVHAILGVAGLIWLRNRASTSAMFYLGDPKFLFPAGIIAAGSLLLAFSSSIFLPPAETLEVSTKQIVFIAFVPIVEEVFFRGLVGAELRRKLGNWTGAYLSALFFSWMHSSPSFEAILGGNTGIVLGPLLLGIIAETLIIKSGGSLIPGMFLHMICNATVPIFAAIDSRWLQWLGVLYH